MTIYRRHRDRREMLSAALSRMTAIKPLAAQVEAPDQLRWLIREAVKTIEVGFGFGGFAALLTDDDPDFTKLFRRNRADKRAALDHSPSISTFDTVDAKPGPHVYERARTGRVASGSETRLFDLFWPIMQRRPR